MAVKIYDMRTDSMKSLTDKECQALIRQLNDMGKRYYELRNAIAVAIKTKKRLPKEVKQLFMEHQEAIDLERGIQNRSDLGRAIPSGGWFHGEGFKSALEMAVTAANREETDAA